MEAKQTVRELLDRLPDDCTWRTCSIISMTRSPRHLGVDGSPGPASSLDPRRAEDPPLGTGLRSADGGRHKSGSYYRGGRERRDVA